MGLDEVGTAHTLREHRAASDALVKKHGGRIVKTMGDGVLLEFPSVVDAVECAVAVQAVMADRNDGIPQDRRMLYRIGINLGDILVEVRPNSPAFMAIVGQFAWVSRLPVSCGSGRSWPRCCRRACRS